MGGWGVARGGRWVGGYCNRGSRASSATPQCSRPWLASIVLVSSIWSCFRGFQASYSTISGPLYFWAVSPSWAVTLLNTLNFYRLRVPCLSDIMKPVTSLSSNNGSIKETTELRWAFNDAKEAMRQKINLAAFNPTRPVYLITNTSNAAWGALVTHDLSEVCSGPLANTYH